MQRGCLKRSRSTFLQPLPAEKNVWVSGLISGGGNCKWALCLFVNQPRYSPQVLLCYSVAACVSMAALRLFLRVDWRRPSRLTTCNEGCFFTDFYFGCNRSWNCIALCRGGFSSRLASPNNGVIKWTFHFLRNFFLSVLEITGNLTQCHFKSNMSHMTNKPHSSCHPGVEITQNYCWYFHNNCVSNV